MPASKLKAQIGVKIPVNLPVYNISAYAQTSPVYSDVKKISRDSQELERLLIVKYAFIGFPRCENELKTPITAKVAAIMAGRQNSFLYLNLKIATKKIIPIEDCKHTKNTLSPKS